MSKDYRRKRLADAVKANLKNREQGEIVSPTQFDGEVLDLSQWDKVTPIMKHPKWRWHS